MVPLEDIQFDSCLNYIERSLAVMDRNVKTLRNEVVDLVKVQWQHQKRSEWTWEPETNVRKNYPNLFVEVDFENEV